MLYTSPATEARAVCWHRSYSVLARVGAALVGVECGWAGLRLLEFVSVKTCGAVNSNIFRGFTASVPSWFPQPQRLRGSSAELDTKNHGHSCHMANIGSSYSSLFLTISRLIIYSKSGNLYNALKGWGKLSITLFLFSQQGEVSQAGNFPPGTEQPWPGG